ncbi:MAG: uroporphyrinogen-III C-methyltransferase [Saezia sp.]
MKSTSKKSSHKPTTTSQQAEATEQEKTSAETVDLKNNDAVEEKQDLPQEHIVSAAEEIKPEQAKTSAPQEESSTKNTKATALLKAAITPPAASSSTAPSPATSAGKLITVLALLLAGGAVTFSAIMWQQVAQLEQKLNASMNEVSDSNAPNLSTESLTLLATNAAKQQTQALTGKIDSLQRTLEGVQNELDAINQGDKQVDLITDIYNNPKTDMLPLSIRSLLTSAQLHVTLGNSVQPMLATLTSIDNHLKANGMDDNNMLRQAIGADIESIRNYPTTDPLKAARDINALVDLISQDNTALSVRTLTPPTAPPVDLSVNIDLSDAPIGDQTTADSSTWGTIKNTLSWTADKASEVGSATWEQLSSLVQVTPLNHDAQLIILSNNEGAMLRENIKLRLIGARITILQGQYEQAGKELLDIRKVIATYFDSEKAGSILQRLETLSEELKNTSFPQPVHTIAALDSLQSNQ